MPACLLDTSVIIDAINDKKGRRQLLRNLIEQGYTLACCAVSVAEVYAGMLPKEEQATTAFLSSLEYFEIDFSAAALAGDLKREFRKKGTTLSIPDTLIAATALQYRLTLLTDNTKDFPMQDLDLYLLPKG